MYEMKAAELDTSEIVDSIQEASFRAKLLAFNLNMEAVRDIESGRDYSRIATRLRDLATQSAAIALQVQHVFSTSEANGAGTTRETHDADEVLQEIDAAVKKVNRVVSVIARESRNQLVPKAPGTDARPGILGMRLDEAERYVLDRVPGLEALAGERSIDSGKDSVGSPSKNGDR